ncbi:major capsid protein [Endozoicomonas sp. 4G]|uniref:major capsid protein n=1 Tax=Endozoicomonas sp. 4G TaxID=2872754 RepID=UPI0020785CF6|nr:major capsid protein [Endozoicomonas sp. 4G]
MPTLDIFNSDAFSVSSLTASINHVTEGQAVPSVVDALFLQGERGISTTTAWVERKGDSLQLVPAAPRGADADPVNKSTRDGQTFTAIHLPTRGGINADQVQNVRAFGSETEEEVVERMVQDELDRMRRNLSATITYHRMGAIKGLVLDATGSTLLDIHDAFNVSQQSQSMELDQAGTDIRALIIKAKRLSEKAVAGSMVNGFVALCGETFFDLLVNHGDTKEAFDRYMDGEMLRNDPRSGFSFGGVVWRELYGKVGNTEFIDDEHAYLIPLGVPDLFITRWAPADYMETVNTLGIPYYAKQELRRMGKGVDLEAQSNPINLCTRPRAVIKLTHT